MKEKRSSVPVILNNEHSFPVSRGRTRHCTSVKKMDYRNNVSDKMKFKCYI